MNRNRKYALIHIALGQLDISEAEHRAMLCKRYPECFKGSSTELTDNHLDDYIEHLKGCGFVPKKPRRERKPKGIAALVTKGQLGEIDRLSQGISWRFSDGLKRFARKVLKGKERPASTKDAAKLTEALKGLRKTQERKRVDG